MLALVYKALKVVGCSARYWHLCGAKSTYLVNHDSVFSFGSNLGSEFKYFSLRSKAQLSQVTKSETRRPVVTLVQGPFPSAEGTFPQLRETFIQYRFAKYHTGQ